MKEDLKLRFVKKEDLNRIEEILQQVQMLHVQIRPDIYKPTKCLMEESRLLDLIEQKTALVAVVNEVVQGYADWLIREYQSPVHVTRKVLFLDTIAVEESYRHKGIGRCMLDWILEYAKKQKLDGVELQVNARNKAARKIYEQYGFQEKSINLEMKIFLAE